MFMTEVGRQVDFDDFDEQIIDALADNKTEMGKLAVRGFVAVPDSLRQFQTPKVTEIPRIHPDYPDSAA